MEQLKLINDDFSAKSIFKEIRNFLAGRFVGATRDEFLLNELIKIIFCKFHIKNNENFEIGDPLEISNIYRKAFKEIKYKYSKLFTEEEELELDPISIAFINEKLSQINLNNLKRDPIGDAYEIFIGESIKGQSGQFFTPRNAANLLVDILDPKPGEKVLDLACGAGGFIVATLIHFYELGYSKEEIEAAISNIHGVDKDEYLTQLAQIHIAALTGVIPNINCEDSLVWNKDILGEGNDKYDLIITNPPYGANIKAGSVETLSKYDLGYKWRKQKNGGFIKTKVINEAVAPQVVFVEQCINLVKPGGKIGIVVPESLISNKKYAYVVQFIRSICTVEGVIGMPEALFKTSGKGGTHTKTCLVVLKKKEKTFNESDNSIFLAEAKWCGHDSRGREIPNDDLPLIKKEYYEYKKRGSLNNISNLGYIIKSSDINSDVLAPRYYNPEILSQKGKFEKTHNMVKISTLIDNGVLEFNTGHEVGKLAYGTGEIPFVRTSDISNWEIKSDPKHCVSEEVYNSLSEKQDIQEEDILMVKDGTYLIGTCALITNYDTKMVYQSHLYKIRVKKDNEYNITPYFLLALLSSDYVQAQIKINTFSQDIIDSLGDRYKDIYLPIPRSNKKINEITNMVKKSIFERIEARELARRSRIEVLM
ncbi:N-6 DNA methylase [Clostridium perfringens]